jgi:hypothetical protein
MAKKATTKPAKTQKTQKAETGVRSPRRLKPAQYKRLRYSKRIKHPGPKLSGSFRLFAHALVVLKKNWKLFGGIVLVYGVLSMLFVRGFSSGLHLGEVKGTFDGLFNHGTMGDLSSSAALFGVLLGSAGAGGSEVGGVYQTVLMLVVSLALIWALRQVNSTTAKKPSIKQAFYKSMHPLIPFLLVLIVVAIKLLPLLIGATVYGAVVNNGLAVDFAQKAIWGLGFFALAVWSIYMATSSLLALYIVTLPDMTPMKALRSARELLRYRRWTVMRKVVFLPITILVLAAIIMIPLIMFLTPAAEWIFFGLSMLGLAIVHSYMYSLYRELL